MSTSAVPGSAPGSPSKKVRQAWYSTERLMAARVPIGFVMHIGAHLLLKNYSFVLELAIVPLIWWELSQEFPRRGSIVLAALTTMSFVDMYLLQYHPEIDIFQIAGLRALLSGLLCSLVGVTLIDNIILNYLMVAVSSALFLLHRFPADVFLTISMAIAGSDCMQYFTGKLTGRTKIVKKISPNKSLEGYLGAFVGCNLIFFFWLIENSQLSVTESTIYVNGMILCGILGDLFISWWKRNHGLKDTSSLLLAHGGILDRLDSHLGAWLWTILFVFVRGIPTGVNFTAMRMDRIEWLIIITWAALWSHFFIRRLFSSRAD